MADKKITELDPIAAVQPTTLLVVVDDPSGTPVTKKATVAQLLASASQIEYLGDYVAGTYNAGDIVVWTDGIAYLCVKNGTTTPPEPWPLEQP